MNRSLNCGLILVLLEIFISCAKISSPSGGPRDKLPPVVIKTVPGNGTKNFKDNSISATFNEYVVLDNINDKFMISPPVKTKPLVFIRGKSVNVRFEEKLKDSTTYTLYFQDAIRDLNESNILENYQFVFSTGPVIDSLSVTGNVFKSPDLEVPEKTSVLLYSDLTDSAAVKKLPDYISQVNQDGYFRFENVRAGMYRLYALKDADNSKNYNLPDEEFAFMNSPVIISPEKNYIPVVKDTTTTAKAKPGASVKIPLIGEYQLFLFQAQKRNRYLTSSARDLKYHLRFVLSLPPDTFKFEVSIPGAGKGAFYQERSKENDTADIWLTDSTLYSQPQINTIVKYPLSDSSGKVIYKSDSINMRFLQPRLPRLQKVKKKIFKFSSNISAGMIKPEQKIVFNSQTPFRNPDTSIIRLYEIEEKKRINIPYSFVQDNSTRCRYYLETNLQPGRKYLLIANSASFGNIYNENSDSTGINFSVRDLDSFNKLTLSIKNVKGSNIIQLLNNSDKVISEKLIKKDGQVVFSLLENGLYRVRSIYDINGDGKWTTGDFFSGRQPEPVSYYNQELDIRKGWDFTQEWNLTNQNFKDQKLREKKKTK